MTTKVTSEFLHQAIISDHTEVSAANTDHVLIHDASDNTLKKALISTITGTSSSVAADDIAAGDAAITLSTSSGNITIDNGSSDDDIIFKGNDSGAVVTALALDMSDAGKAIFNSSIEVGPASTISNASGNLTMHVTEANMDLLFTGNDGGSSITALTLDMSDAGTAIFNHDIKNVSGDMKIDVVGSIILDADNNGEVSFQDAGTEIGKIFSSSTDFAFEAGVQDKDILFRGNDGGTGITALTLDMSNKGRATFNEYVILGEADDARLYFNASSGYSPRIQSATNDLTLYTNNSERLRLKNDGKLGLGTSTPDTDGYSFAEDFVIMAGASASDGVGITLNSSSRRYGVIAFGDSANDNEGEIWYDHQVNSFNMRTANVQRFQLDSSGNAIFTGNVTAYGSISDERLKENIKVIENPIEKIKDLKGVTFTYKKDGEKSTGLIAQDLEKVLPEAVYTSETVADEREGEVAEEHLAIRYGNTVGLLVEAIKELSAKIEKLEGK
jgi:hypothetical protein